MKFTSCEALLAEMTVDEKVAQLSAVSITDLLSDGALDPKKVEHCLRHGAGHIARVAGWTHLQPAEAKALGVELQEFLRNQTRLGVPAILHEECMSGLQARGATVYPQAISTASTWNPALLEEMAAAIRLEMRAVGAHQGLGPVLDLIRDPRWGRSEETFGEDPYLAALMAIAVVRGLQGDDLETGVGATLKHFAGHGSSEGGRNEAPVHMGKRELRDVILPPFERVVKETDVLCVMNAYHDIDGVPCAASHELLTGILRGEWGFNGVVVSDYEAVDQLRRMHFVARDKSDAARIALEAGLDIELPFRDCYGGPLHEAIANGDVAEDILDRAVLRVLAAKEKLGLFSESVGADQPDLGVLNCGAHRRLATQVAGQSLVLLKNEKGTLPLSSSISSIAVIGPNADSVRNLQGDYAFEGAYQIDDPSVQGISILAGVKNLIEDGGEITYVQGCDVGMDDRSGFAKALAAVEAADVVIMAVGGRSGSAPVFRGYHEHGDTSGEGRDRSDINLPGVQEALVEEIARLGKPLVLVIVDGRPVALGKICECADAIIHAWLPGKMGGGAIADALFGKINPGGKLPASMPREVGQIPVHYARHPASSKWHYIFGPNTPLFPFGHGLSYTTFEYSNLRMNSDKHAADGVLEVNFTVTNTGDVSGDETPQLYIYDKVATAVRPVKELKRFERITLQPGEAREMTFSLPISELAFHNKDMRRVVEPGEFDLMIGASSADIRLEGGFEVVA